MSEVGHKTFRRTSSLIAPAIPSLLLQYPPPDRGYGFIAPDDGGSVFVHVHDVEAARMKILVGAQLVPRASTMAPSGGRPGFKRSAEQLGGAGASEPKS